MKKYYLAYGSNLNVQQMQYRCPGAVPVGTAIIPDYQLLFKGSKTGSYLTIEPKKGTQVPVAVWEVSEDNELQLDRYEGCPNFYYKAEMDVLVQGEKKGRQRRERAFVYIMHEDHCLGRPSISYFKTCLEGYEFFGFDPAFLMQAYLDSIKGE